MGLVLFDVSLEEEDILTSVMFMVIFMSHVTSGGSHPVSGRKQLLQVGQPFKDKPRPLVFTQLPERILIQQETVSLLHHGPPSPPPLRQTLLPAQSLF